ncbi:helix-hairpin-helix domain-containing protein [Halapricum hydrolyticum]|uniref:Helix-hairpin-helix domain-containing protein n=1 Tax=Halapricum hydrolyticum TaxID=2979991 RepID=A0AAE3LER4_9EURY|nr:helix-hairpin-helix domain-containing protein [Halapricum hydrolyticum]MCU4717705.1 helix-hairpin-helix domain-containing protein [Halapricum hydrolyticum]MCU4726766.1 helix-hairpin-helix domain-containing protein [Halapricum hydrolyticum]
MGLSELLDRIKEALGIGGSRGQSERRPPQSGDETATEPTSKETTVTVEREPSTESEDAVKGTDTADETEEDTDSVPTTEDAETAVEDEATASDTEAETDEAETDDESSEAETDEEETDDESSEAETDEEPSETGAGEDLGTDEPTDVIKGIGSAYADRLADAGVETVADLAARDAESLSEETDISEKRLQTWIERAKHR